MKHRHLNHENFTLAAIDDIISRGNRYDWRDLLYEMSQNHEVIIPKILKVCEPKIVDPYAQRYILWYTYAKAKREEFSNKSKNSSK